MRDEICISINKTKQEPEPDPHLSASLATLQGKDESLAFGPIPVDGLNFYANGLIGSISVTHESFEDD